METQVSNIFLSIQNQQKWSPRVVDQPDFRSRVFEHFTCCYFSICCIA